MPDIDFDTGAVPGTSKALWKALRRLLRPLVRLLLGLQVTYPQVSALLKEVFVEVGDRDFRLKGKRQTDSRVSLLTGIHRKDVKRLRQTSHSPSVAPPALSLGEQIHSRWISRAEWLDELGKPLALSRQDDSGRPSFEALVESVSRDIRPRSVLDEWRRLGVAHLDEEGNVALDASAFVPSKGFDEKSFYLGRNVADHIAAAAHNLTHEAETFVERSVYYNRLTEASGRELRRLSEEKGMEALEALNLRAAALQTQDRGVEGNDHRFNFGIYVYQEVDSPSQGGVDPDED